MKISQPSYNEMNIWHTGYLTTTIGKKKICVWQKQKDIHK